MVGFPNINLFNGGFWQEWEDSADLQKNLMLIYIGIMLILGFVYTNFPAEARPASVFLFLGLLAGLAFLVDAVLERNPLVGFGGFGKSNTVLIVAMAVGAVMGYLLVANSLAIETLSVTLPTQLLDTLYKVIAAPIVEEMAFRGFIYFTLVALLVKRTPYAGIIALFGQALLFGAFHLYAYQASTTALFSAFIWGLVAGFGNLVFKSLGFSMSLHFMNNLLMSR